MTKQARPGPVFDFNDLRRVLSLLPSGRTRRLGLLAGLSLVNALCEASAIALVVPILRIMLGTGTDADQSSTLFRLLPTSSSATTLAVLCFAVALLLILSNLLSAVVIGMTTRFSWDSWRDVTARVFRFYLEHPYDFFLQRNSTQLIKMTAHDTMKMTNRVLVPALQVLSRSGIIIVVSLTLLWLFPVIALILLVVLVIAYSTVYLIVRPRIKRKSLQVWKSQTAASRTIGEAYQCIKELIVFGRELAYVDRLNQITAPLPNLERQNATLQMLPRYLLQGGLTALVLVFIGLAAIAGYPIDSLGTSLGVCALAGLRLMPMFSSVYHQFVEMRVGLSELGPLLDDLDQAHSPAQSDPDGEKTMDEAGSLTVPAPLIFSQVSYRYPASEHAAIENVTFTIPPGKVVGLVGSSGSGKSTLIDVLLGLCPASDGSIALGDTVLTPALYRALRQHIGYVSQHTMLIDDTVASNIAFGIPPSMIDQRAVRKAARLCAIDKVIEQLPEGYEQVLGDRGMRLSGGQRQRIAMARALYHDPHYLILDEATSALDPATEQSILQGITTSGEHTLSGERTILLATHRFSTLEFCDLIYEVRDRQVKPVELSAVYSLYGREAGNSER